MKLLIITQKVDRNDAFLGFFHRWVNEFAKHFASISVICLEEGEHDLPENVKVLSLGKEERQSRLQYLIHFYWYIIHERKNYDAVFVHMNQEYILLAGWLWKLWGKKVTMWRNHYAGSMLTDVAASMCDTVFCTSKYSYTAKYKKTVLMPVGVDTDFFKPVPSVSRRDRSVLSFGRFSPSKRIDLLVDALIVLHKKGVSFDASIYGNATKQDESYRADIVKKAADAGAKNIRFYPGVPNDQTPSIYSAHEIYVNLAPSGMYDKTIFEAIACGCVTIVSNKDLPADLGPDFFYAGTDAGELAAKIERVLSMSPKDRASAAQSIQQKVLSKHSLSLLAGTLYTVLHE